MRTSLVGHAGGRDRFGRLLRRGERPRGVGGNTGAAGFGRPDHGDAESPVRGTSDIAGGETVSRSRSVIAGAGFAGYRTARTPERPTRRKAGITLLHPTDYFLYPPLLPRAAAGILEPRRVTTLTYDRSVLAVGGVNKLLALPDPYVQVPGRPE